MIVLKKIVYVRETEDKYNIINKIILYIKNILNIIKVRDNKIYYLPILKNKKLSKHKIRKLTNRINILLEKNGVNCVALSEYLDSNQLFKNYLYSNNINILNGRFLFNCLIYKIIEYIFNIKNEEMEFRRSFIINK